MKKLTRRGFTAAGILTALSAGMTFLPGCNLIGCVYGPPSEDYDPDLNEIETVYGPPEYFGLEPEEGDVVDDNVDDVDDGEDFAQDDGDEYDPSENEMQFMYGPMEVYDPDENYATTLYGVPDSFDDFD